jgi:hypothetical protein
MTLSTPLHTAERPGICGHCGLATAYACPECTTAHFCSRRCLEDAQGTHAPDCGQPWCKAVDLPHSGRLRGCWVNALLRNGGRFSLSVERSLWWAQPTLEHGLVPLQLDSKRVADLARVVKEGWADNDFLKIGKQSYPGYTNYTAIQGEANEPSYSPTPTPSPPPTPR